MFAVTISDSMIIGMRGNGIPLNKTITAGRSVSNNQIVLSGAPAGSQLTDGIDGVIGGVSVYNGMLSIDEMRMALNDMRTFMASKGVTIP
ncbi:hypothetical protein QLL80_000882 [Yersinia enterocolitica]|nr:hypothetical protein [Yersinia enterocolitica]